MLTPHASSWLTACLFAAVHPLAAPCCRRADKGGPTPFAGINIVALPLPDNIGSAGSSSEVEAYEKQFGKKVR